MRACNFWPWPTRHSSSADRNDFRSSYTDVTKATTGIGSMLSIAQASSSIKHSAPLAVGELFK
jgi:hypothetical protein